MFVQELNVDDVRHDWYTNGIHLGYDHVQLISVAVAVGELVKKMSLMDYFDSRTIPAEINNDPPQFRTSFVPQILDLSYLLQG